MAFMSDDKETVRIDLIQSETFVYVIIISRRSLFKVPLDARIHKYRTLT